MFKFSYRRRFFWKTFKVSGFACKDDRMALYFSDGAQLEIAKWSECDCRLGADYFNFRHKQMQKEAGQAIPVDKEADAN